MVIFPGRGRAWPDRCGKGTSLVAETLAGGQVPRGAGRARAESACPADVAAHDRGERLSHGRILHPGRVRSHNEDCCLADPGLGLWLVADGMGGHQGGEVASRVAVDYVHDRMRRGGGSLVEAVTEAHRILQLAARDRLGMPGMGSTIVALRLEAGGAYELAWVGDSRAYLWHGGTLRQLTRDHSYVQELVDSGRISPRSALRHPKRHVITQALGAPDVDEPGIGRLSGQAPPRAEFLLCSDGLTGELSDLEIGQVLRAPGSCQARVEQLLDRALDAGGHDNIAALLVEVEG